MDSPIWVGNTIMSRWDLLLLCLYAVAGVLFWLICHGSAFADGCKPMWRWPRPPGAPEWDTDVNGKARLLFTWLATLMDLAILYLLVRWLINRMF